MLTDWLDPADRNEIRACLAGGLGSPDLLAKVARDAGVPVARIDLARSADLVADDIIEAALRTGRLTALQRELRLHAPEFDRRWPHVLSWAGVSGRTAERAHSVHLHLQIAPLATPDAASGALEDPSRPALTVIAPLVERAEPTAPGMLPWPLVADRIQDLGDFLCATLRPDAELHVFVHPPLPLPATMMLGFHLRRPAPIRTIVHQRDPGPGGWTPWPEEMSPAAEPQKAASRADSGRLNEAEEREHGLFHETETALDAGAPIRSREALVMVVSSRPRWMLREVVADQRALKLPEDAPCVMLTWSERADRNGHVTLLAPADGPRAADAVRDAVRRMRNRHGDAPIHLFYAGPSALALMIGTRLNGMGTFLLYNLVTGHGSSHKYDLAAQLRSR